MSDHYAPVTLTDNFPGEGEAVWWPSMAGRCTGRVVRVVGTRIEVRPTSWRDGVRVFVAGERYLLRRGTGA